MSRSATSASAVKAWRSKSSEMRDAPKTKSTSAKKNSINTAAGALDPRRGCFRFLSSSSSRDSTERSKSAPQSAAPNTRVTRAPKNLSKNPKLKVNSSKTSSENQKIAGSKEDATSRGSKLQQCRNYQKPSSEDPKRGTNSVIDLSFDSNLVNNFNQTTPDKSIPWFKPSFILEKNGAGIDRNQRLALITPEKDIENVQFSGTPHSAATPPVQASISPELTCVLNVAPTPACFAAGHVVAGVQGRRKCRPRDILTIDRETDRSKGLRTSLILPPIEEALTHPPSEFHAANRSNFSSNSGKKDWGREPSANWLLSPSAHWDEHDDANFKYPWDEDMSLCSLLDMTPTSGNSALRTPTSGSSISPFSMILRRTEKKAQSKGFGVGQESPRNSYRGDSTDSENVMFTSLSDTRFSTQDGLPSFKEDSVADCSNGLTSIPKPRVKNDDGGDVLPLPGLSFQLEFPLTPTTSIDFVGFQKALLPDKLNDRGNLPLDPDVRISWREGLESRIFEIGQLGSYQWLTDDEHEEKCDQTNEFETESIIQRGTSEDRNNHYGPKGFGSMEILMHDIACPETDDAKYRRQPISCAESISTDGGGLISSGDSDWNLFYKNYLFEI